VKVTGGVVAVGTAVAMGAVVALGGTVVLGGVAALELGGSPDSPGDLCAGLPQPGPGRLTPSRDLYCLQLVPAAGPIGIEGTLSLLPFRSTFGTAVAPDGRHRFDGVLTLRGLPEPEEFGPYSTYIAWITTPVFTPLIKLGPVENGTNAVGIVDLEKFVVLVSAEASPDVGERTGPLVLRGRSPSTRMRSPDFFEFAMGGRSDHGEHERADGTQPAAKWVPPPMPAGLSMLPALMDLRPGVGPFLPAVDSAQPVPVARPREVLQLTDGDSLELVAGFVRRRLRGRELLMYGFNGQYPGPLLWVPEAARVTVGFRNEIDLPTTVHWHGVRLDNRYDGVPGVTQELVPPGGSFRYEIFFRDPGIYWYHPHHREDITQDLGLYGNMLVRSSRPDYYGPAHREEVVVLDDLLLGDTGLVPFGDEAATHALMGRFGNLMLVNGEPDYALEVRAGEVVRFFLTNVSNTRTFNLSLPGARLKVVGSDVGNFEREEWVESVVIAPAERYIVHARFDRPGDVPLLNRVRGIDHLYGRFIAEEDTLGVVTVSREDASPDLDAEFGRLREHRHVVEEIARYRMHFDRPVDRELVLSMESRELPFLVDRLMQLDSAYFNPVEWSGTMPLMNWVSTTRQVEWKLLDPATGAVNEEIDWRFRVGDVVKIRLSNERRVLHAMQHPIHLHGQRFLVLAVNGSPTDNLVWKDTVLLPVGATVDILLELSNPGDWMLHCHIAEHLESGMKMVFTVEGEAESRP
jgi:FtsP/CotA-like multicopper oxidase with cupredoxin domain